MADMHFPKACAYPGGWESDHNTLGNLIGDSKLSEAFINEAGRNNLLGDFPNDKNAISLCVIGRMDT